MKNQKGSLRSSAKSLTSCLKHINKKGFPSTLAPICDANEMWHDPCSQIHSQSLFAHLICFSDFPLLLHVQCFAVPIFIAIDTLLQHLGNPVFSLQVPIFDLGLRWVPELLLFNE